MLTTILTLAALMATPAPPADWYPLAADEQSPVIDCLLAAGYHGLPGDQAEVIYAPAGAIDACLPARSV